ncbi:metal-dependent hydrolase [Kutzneria albida]|uniref:Membrane-bound metal-dependent hydrolase n=1 Tax=Kutzneria albida DSM 43870 TaxID=1449976 RepID=W5WC04_9PSEU|nr:metal-dependent hydrolase [Kutzneria albida]AHH98285.1 hypothetical protein KALB_4923 [Kutzneria albida DSM 43870]
MLGRTHAVSGWCAGLVVAPAVGVHGLGSVLLFATVTAGWALAPDLDHPGSVATRFAGPVTGILSRGLRGLSARLYAGTKGPRDEDWEGTHRHLTHTLLFAVLVGAGTAVGTAVSPWWGVLVPVAVGTLLAARALGDWVLVAGTVPVAWGLVAGGDSVLEVLSPVRGWIGIAVGLGCLAHSCGDALTLSGCPILFPIPIRGETWFELGPPRVMRFRTGGTLEQLVVFPAFAAAGVMLVPGVWPLVASTIGHVLGVR